MFLTVFVQPLSSVHLEDNCRGSYHPMSNLLFHLSFQWPVMVSCCTMLMDHISCHQLISSAWKDAWLVCSIQLSSHIEQPNDAIHDSNGNFIISHILWHPENDQRLSLQNSLLTPSHLTKARTVKMECNRHTKRDLHA